MCVIRISLSLYINNYTHICTCIVYIDLSIYLSLSISIYLYLTSRPSAARRTCPKPACRWSSPPDAQDTSTLFVLLVFIFCLTSLTYSFVCSLLSCLFCCLQLNVFSLFKLACEQDLDVQPEAPALAARAAGVGNELLPLLLVASCVFL